jgi:peroxiredoxin Q/BCP
MKMLRDSKEVFQKADTVILGVSVASVKSHGKFCESLGLSFDLLADTDKKIHKAYGFGRLARSLVLVDKKGVIAFVDKKYRLKKEEWEDLLRAVEEVGGNPKPHPPQPKK